MSCAQFDGQVVRRHELIADLMDQFICVRLTHAEQLDLEVFQFDNDLSFAVFLLGPDETIYGRFGTRSDFYEAERDISLEGLRQALQTSLQWHHDLSDRSADHAALIAGLAKKRGPKPRYRSFAETPRKGRSGWSRSIDNESTGGRCVHCHNLRTAEQLSYRATGQSIPDRVLFAWPMPDVIGMHLDPQEMATISSVTDDSPAAIAGLKAGDRIVELEGQPILSIADVQWVLQCADDRDELEFIIERSGQREEIRLTLGDQWRRSTDIVWRITTGELRRKILGGVEYRDLEAEQRSDAGVPLDTVALRAARGVSKYTGLIRRGDIIVGIDGNKTYLSESDLIAYLLQHKEAGDTVALTLIRNGEEITVSVPVP